MGSRGWKAGALLAVLAGAVALGAHGGRCRGAGAGARLVATGSSTLAPLMAEIGKRFEAHHPGVRVDVQAGGSSRGVQDVLAGMAGLGLVSRPLLGAEAAQLRAFALARDGIALIAHATNPLPGLSTPQVRAIFRGQLTRWEQLGGRPGPITVVSKAAGRGTLLVFLEHFGLQAAEIRAQALVGDNEHGVKTVAANPGAIGYVSIGTAAADVRRGVPIKLLALDGVVPSAEQIAAGRYPLVRPLLLVTRGEPGGLVRELLDFARAEGVDDLVRTQGFVPLER
ncbi:MAG: phosphate ABC transporter substrate-binding protein [Planctomycetota bacterium]|nr:MAG: phosphate ABC transporter substrate-binding protein [Planctomycetota bacterium]